MHSSVSGEAGVVHGDRLRNGKVTIQMVFLESTCLREAAKAARRSVLLFSLVLCGFIFSTGWLHAQNAAMSGLITDPTGAVVQHARVALTNERTHAIWKITSDNNGLYSVPHVPPGSYTINVDAPGFKHYEQTGITITSAQALALDAHLQLGSASQQVTVNGNTVGYVALDSSAGTKSDTPILETPQSIAVVTQQEMETQVPDTVSQALRYTPGVTADYNGADMRDAATSRGFGADSYLDGLKLAGGTFTYSSLDPYVLDRIELVKGPSAALYGQSNPGGLINEESKRPTVATLHEIEFETGSYGRVQGGFDFGGGIGSSSHWLYRLTGTGYNTGTQVDKTNLSRMELAPAITWRPDDKTALTMLFQLRYDPNIGFWNKLPALGSLLPNPDGQISPHLFTGDLGFNQFFNVQGMGGYLFQRALNKTWTIRQNLRYEYVAEHFNSVQGDSLSGTTLVRDKFQDIDSLFYFIEDTNAEASFNTGALHHTFLIGSDYQNSVERNQEADADAPSLDILAPDYRQPLLTYTPSDYYDSYKQPLSQVGVYAQDQLSIGGWRAALSIRHDSTSETTHDRIGGTTATQSEQAWSGRSGLLYLFNSGIAPYVSYSTSFEPDIGTNAYAQAFKPTTGQQFEFGMKYRPRQFNALFTASLFDLKEQNVLPIRTIRTTASRQARIDLWEQSFRQQQA